MNMYEYIMRISNELMIKPHWKTMFKLHGIIWASYMLDSENAVNLTW